MPGIEHKISPENDPSSPQEIINSIVRTIGKKTTNKNDGSVIFSGEALISGGLFRPHFPEISDYLIEIGGFSLDPEGVVLSIAKKLGYKKGQSVKYKLTVYSEGQHTDYESHFFPPKSESLNKVVEILANQIIGSNDKFSKTVQYQVVIHPPKRIFEKTLSNKADLKQNGPLTEYF